DRRHCRNRVRDWYLVNRRRRKPRLASILFARSASRHCRTGYMGSVAVGSIHRATSTKRASRLAWYVAWDTHFVLGRSRNEEAAFAENSVLGHSANCVPDERGLVDRRVLVEIIVGYRHGRRSRCIVGLHVLEPAR